MTDRVAVNLIYTEPCGLLPCGLLPCRLYDLCNVGLQVYVKLHNHTEVGKLIILLKTALHNEKHTLNRYFI